MIVRLKDLCDADIVEENNLFQFYDSPIKRQPKEITLIPIEYGVSIL